MNRNARQGWIRWIGGVAALAALLTIFTGIWRGMRRPVGMTAGRAPGWLRSPLFYVVTSALFGGFCILLWRPLPLALSSGAQAGALTLGALLYFPGMAFVLWGRLTLGRMYFVSTSSGAQLFADHQLITRGAFAIVRHPMYAGLIAVGFGGLLIYRTWTWLFIAAIAPALLLRARREEQALAARFGAEWEAYKACVPAWIPWRRR